MDHGIWMAGGLIFLGLFAGGILAIHLRQSVVPFYLLLGMILHPFIEKSEIIEVLSSAGIILLLFFLGLEFSLSNLLKNRKRMTKAGIIDLGINFPFGFLLGWIFGLSWMEVFLLAGIFYISSSAIITKTIIENKTAAFPETEPILGLLIFEDLFIAIFLAILSGIILSPEWKVGYLIWAATKGLLFLTLFLSASRLLLRPINHLFRVDSLEMFILIIFAFLLLSSGAALALGLSEAIGAFLAGLLLAETEHVERVREMLIPYRELLGAIFFFAFGLKMDYSTFSSVFWMGMGVLIFAILGKMGSGLWIGKGEKLSRRASINIGLMTIPRGEFSIVLATLAFTMSSQSTLPSLAAFLILSTAILGPLLLRLAPKIFRFSKR